MRINKVAFIGKGGVGLLYGGMIARVLGDDAQRPRWIETVPGAGYRFCGRVVQR